MRFFSSWLCLQACSMQNYRVWIFWLFVLVEMAIWCKNILLQIFYFCVSFSGPDRNIGKYMEQLVPNKSWCIEHFRFRHDRLYYFGLEIYPKICSNISLKIRVTGYNRCLHRSNKDENALDQVLYCAQFPNITHAQETQHNMECRICSIHSDSRLLL